VSPGAKRFVDVAIATCLLAVFLPFGVLIGIAIYLTDGAPIFFLHERIGLHGKPFKLIKFRTMFKNPAARGAQITLGSRDSRITPAGYYLRMLKLDEVPQLINVLRGEMSIVGPRPEVAYYVDRYSPEQRRVLEMLPGMTDISVIRGHLHDTELLDAREADERERYYVEVLIPRKIRLNLEYFAQRSVWFDFKIMLQTVLLLAGLAKQPTRDF
jgi:lipopolysaccharide/colanic/teichoic acid biosynthesis glycosyltransferase